MKEEFEKLPLRNVGGDISSVWTFRAEKFDLFVPFLPEHSHYVANLPSDGNLHLDRVKKDGFFKNPLATSSKIWSQADNFALLRALEILH